MPRLATFPRECLTEKRNWLAVPSGPVRLTAKHLGNELQSYVHNFAVSLSQTSTLQTQASRDTNTSEIAQQPMRSSPNQFAVRRLCYVRARSRGDRSIWNSKLRCLLAGYWPRSGSGARAPGYRTPIKYVQVRTGDPAPRRVGVGVGGGASRNGLHGVLRTPLLWGVIFVTSGLIQSFGNVRPASSAGCMNGSVLKCLSPRSNGVVVGLVCSSVFASWNDRWLFSVALPPWHAKLPKRLVRCILFTAIVCSYRRLNLRAHSLQDWDLVSKAFRALEASSNSLHTESLKCGVSRQIRWNSGLLPAAQLTVSP